VAGPIARAFVDIVARWEMEDPSGDIEAGIRRQIEKVESQLRDLEGVAKRAGATVKKSLDNLKITLDVRPAIASITKLEQEADETLISLRALQRLDVKAFGGASKAATQIDRIDVAVKKLGLDLQRIDDETIVFDVAGAKRSLNILEDAIARLNVQLTTKSPKYRIKTEEAIADLERLQNKVQAAVRATTDLKGTTIKVKVNDLELDNVAKKVKALENETLHIKSTVDDSGLNKMSKRVNALNVSLLDFGDQFRNIAFRAASYLAVGTAMASFQRMIQFGIQAAAEIETVTVGLNRLFADMPQLGQTASSYIRELKSVALKTPFEFIDLAETSRRLVQLGGDADLSIERMNALADAGAAVGATSEDINGVVRALTQMSAKGKINLQDLNQVAERLPNFQRKLQLRGVIQELEDMGSPLAGTIDSFEDLRAAGVPIETVIKGIFRGLELIPGAAGAAAAQARTLTGALSNLRDFAQIEFAESFRGIGVILADELNAAFDESTGAVTEASSEMAESLREIIGAFGSGLTTSLPSVIDYFTNISDELAGILDAVGLLVESFATGFAGDFAAGIMQGLTGVLNMVTALNEMLSMLPQGFGEGIGQVATQMIALTRVGINAFAPFQKVVNDGVEAWRLYTTGVLSAGKAVKSLGPALAGAGIAAVGIAIFTHLTDTMATAARRNRELQQQIDQSTSSMIEFAREGDVAVEFLDQFATGAEKVQLGDFESQFDALYAPEVARGLGITQSKLADLVSELAAVHGAGTDITEGGWIGAVEKFKGFDIDYRSNEAGTINAIKNAELLAAQYSDASMAALEVAVETKEFGLVSDSTAQAILGVAHATGDAAAGLEQLDATNRDMAEIEFAGLAEDLNKTDAEVRSILRGFPVAADGTRDWAGALAVLQGELLEVDDALLDIQERAPDVLMWTDIFKKTIPGQFRISLVGIAEAASKAELSVQEFDALARELGTGFTGEELKAKFDAIVAKVEETKGALDGVIPSFGALQFETDTFSVQKLIDELGRIAEAQVKVEENISNILNTYGSVGAQAIEALLASVKDPEQFAIAVQQLVDDPSLFAPLIEKAGEVGTTTSQAISEKLVSLGMSVADARAFMNMMGWETAGTEAGDAAGTAAGEAAVASATPFLDKILFGEEGRIPEGIRAPGTGPEAATVAPPKIDVSSGEENARAAATQISSAFTSSLSSSMSTAIAEVATTISASISSWGGGLYGGHYAAVAGGQIATAFKGGLDAGLVNLGAVIGQKIAANTMGAIMAGHALGAAAGNGVVSGLRQTAVPGMTAALAEISSALTNFGVQAMGHATNIGAGISRSFQTGVDRMSDAMEAEVSATMQPLVGGVVLFIGLALKAGTGMTKAFQSSLKMAEAASAEMTQVSNALSSTGLASRASAAGQSIGRAFGYGVASGIASTMSAAIGAATRLVNATIAAANRAGGVASPSKVFAELGRNFGRGLAKGMLDSTPQLQKAAAMMGAAAAGTAPVGSSIPASLAGGGTAGALAAGVPPAGGLPAPAGTGRSYSNQFTIVAPTEDPEALAVRVAARLERRLEG
jgi:tape measure domain-containing protein